MLLDITYEEAAAEFPHYFDPAPEYPGIRGATLEEIAEIFIRYKQAMICISDAELLRYRRGLVVKTVNGTGHAGAWSGYRIFDPALSEGKVSQAYGDWEIWKPEVFYILLPLR